MPSAICRRPARWTCSLCWAREKRAGPADRQRAVERPRALWRDQGFWPEAKVILPGEFIRPGVFKSGDPKRRFFQLLPPLQVLDLKKNWDRSKEKIKKLFKKFCRK